MRLETFVKEGFITGDHVVAILFDLEKAYDTTWKYGIMNDLYEIGLRGTLPHLLKIYGSVTPSYIQMLNPLQNQGQRPYITRR